MVRVVPVHEVSESLRLLGDYVGESVNSVFALLHELANAVTLNLVLRLESVLLLDFNFYPESLPVVTVLEPLTVTLHVSEAKEQVFVCASPCVMYAHRVVSGNRPVDEGVALLGRIVPSQVTVND